MKKEENITWDCLLYGNVVKHDLFYRLTNKISWQKLYKLKISAIGTMGNGTLGNGTFQNVSGEMGHFYYLGNGTFYALGEGTLYSLGNGKF